MDDFMAQKLVAVMDNHDQRISALTLRVESLQQENSSLIAQIVDLRGRIEASEPRDSRLPKAEPAHRGAARSTRKEAK